MKRFSVLALFSLLAISSLAQKALYYDEIWGQIGDDNSTRKCLHRTIGKGSAAGIDFLVYSGNCISQPFEDKIYYKYDDDGDCYFNYYLKLNLSVFGSGFSKASYYYAFKYPLSPEWNSSNDRYMFPGLKRSCCASGSKYIRYLYSVENSMEQSPEVINKFSKNIDIAALAIANEWDTDEPIVKPGQIKVWQRGYVNSECLITFEGNAKSVSGKMPKQTFTNAYEDLDYGTTEAFDFTLNANRFTKPGHRFVGWTLDGSETVWEDCADILANTFEGDVTLKAQWEPTNCLVRVSVKDDEGGYLSVDSANEGTEYSCQCLFGNSFVVKAVATDPYRFYKWTDGFAAASRTITADEGANTYAVQFVRDVKVEFNANDRLATGTMKDQKLPYGETTQLTKAGFEHPYLQFVGWSLDGSSQVTYKDEAEVKDPPHDEDYALKLYAVWSTHEVLVSFEPNGGEAVSPSSKIVTSGDVYGELPVVTRKDMTVGSVTYSYSFLGWFTAQSGGEQISTSSLVICKETTQRLYAHWMETAKSNSYLISFDGNYPGCSQQFAQLSIAFNSSIPELPLPTRTGYDFKQWTNAAFGVIKQGDTSRINADSTFYAQWTPKAYKVKFDQQGGSSGPSELSVTYGAAVPDLVAFTPPSKTGHMFLGYTNVLGETAFDQGGKSHLGIWNIDDNVTVYARWKSKTSRAQVTIKFDYNGGTGTEASEKVYVGDDLGELPTGSRDGSIGKTWRFFGWFTAKEGGAEVTPSSVFGADTTVYARWGIGELNELLGEDSVAFLYENTAWKETTADKYLHEGKRTLRVYGVKEDGVTGLRAGEKATLVALPTKSCKLKFWFSSFSMKPSDDPFYAVVDGNTTYLTRTGDEDDTAKWETVEFCATNAVRLTLDKRSEVGGLNAQASLSEFTAEDLEDRPALADWDSAAASGLAADFKLYGTAAWRISAAEGDRAEGVNGLVVDGLSSNSCSTVAFKTRRAGRVSFKWRTSCERGYWDNKGVLQYTDRLELRTNGVVVAAVGGIMTEYETFAVEVPAGCEVSWRYVKDADGVGGADKAWLDAFAFESTGEYAVVFKSEAQADRTRSYAFSKVYSLPGPSELGFTAPGGKTKFAGWKSGDGRRYDDGVLVFNLSASGEDVEMTAIWE